MKRIGILAICAIMLVSCKEKTKEKTIEKTESKISQISQKVSNCDKKKFRLCKEENYFKFSKKHIKLKIPVTDKSLKYAETRNISSEKINAILVHFFGGPECTPKSGKIYQKNIKPIKYSDLNIDANQLKDSLLVAIFVNDEMLTMDDVKIYKDLVKDSESYKAAVEKLRDSSECNQKYKDAKEEGFVKPREDDGDVIGGNG